MFRLIGTLIKVVLGVAFVAALGILIINVVMVSSTEDRILTPVKAATVDFEADCIIVLGCSVKPDGTPSDMLRDRVEKGVELYFLGVAPKLLMSGDNSDVHYNEVACMKELAIDLGVPSEDIFTDHAGLSTYETMYRAREIFGVHKAFIVTQNYHLYRSLFIAKAFEEGKQA
ncbi:MAG: YdcF family protein [Eggerthellaceae bacterium]|nr:YdcF family protein [Eggerthellaceae bacterium]